MIRTVKVPLKYIAKSDEVIHNINKIVYRCNEIMIILYQFLKLYFLYCLKESKEIPTIDVEFIRTTFKIITSKDTGRGRVSKKTLIREQLEKFYNEEFEDLIKNKPSMTNLTHICYDYLAEEVFTNYKNNIEMRFLQYVKRYLNEFYLDKFEKENNEKDDKKRKEQKLEFLKKVRIIKNYILGYDLDNSKNKDFVKDVLDEYKKEANNLKDKIFPNINKNIYYDLKVEPFKFIKHMVFMNNELEKLEKKTFNVFPQRNELTPKYIPLDTCCIVETLKTEKVLEGYKISRDNPTIIWEEFFKVYKKDENGKIFNKKNKKLINYESSNNYVFNNFISTDGYSVSISQIRKDCKHFNKYTKKTKEEKELLKTIKDNEIDNFEYIEDVDPENLKDKIFIGVDPGNRNLLYFIDEKGNTFRYTNKQRYHECKFDRNQKRRKLKLEKNPKIKKIQEEFTINGKTTNYEKYKLFLIEKNILNIQLKEFYKDSEFRKLRWHSFINIQKSENKLIKNIKDKFLDDPNKEIVLGVGNWSNKKQLKNTKSSKNIGLKRLLKKTYNVYLVDEYKTSKICHLCKDENEYFKKLNFKIVKKDGSEKVRHWTHGLLCCKNKNCSKLWVINIFQIFSTGALQAQGRDVNGSSNILEIMKEHRDGNDRPKCFRRNNINDPNANK